MKTIRNYIIVFDVLLLLVFAGTWVEREAQEVFSNFIGQEDIPAMQTGQNHSVGETEDMPEEKKIAITFDDGPNAACTPTLLLGLKERNVKATFFVMGKNVEKYPQIVQQMYDEGHLIGNHTYSHIQLNASNQEVFKEELKKTNSVIREITGEDTLYVRPPYGSWNKEFEKELNMFPVLWDIDPKDWCSKDVGKIVETVCTQAEENDIILLHDQYETSVEAAFLIIDRLTEEGYEFVTVDKILFD